MFIVQFKDDSIFSSANGTWDELPKKDIKKLILLDRKLSPYVVENFDVYFYVNEGITHGVNNVTSSNLQIMGSPRTEVSAIIGGGLNRETKKGTIIKINFSDYGIGLDGVSVMPADSVTRCDIHKNQLPFSEHVYKENSL